VSILIEIILFGANSRFIERNNLGAFTAVGYAATISTANINELFKNNLNYIAGERLANFPAALLERIDEKITWEDGKSFLVKANMGFLICSYSSKRYRKDKFEMEKQIEKAKQVISTPSKSRKLKFLDGHRPEDFIWSRKSRHQVSKRIRVFKGIFQSAGHQTLSNTWRT
jgi:hypothetical protein